MNYTTNQKTRFLILILGILLFKSNAQSQCAGSDNSITICNKETYNQGIGNSNGVVDLFNLLGTATSGGTWQNINSANGFNQVTGILTTFQTTQGGVYNFQYTINGVPSCTDNTSIITVTLGGFPGVNNPSAVACDNNTSVPLFSFLGSSPNPHFNGVWSGGPAGAITGNFFNAQLAGIGTYNLFYTVPSVGTCPSRVANISLTVHPLPESGTPTNLTYCETDDFSGLTNVDLFNLLIGEDGGGFWTDNFPTGEISGTGDSFINIQNIFTNFGPGTYTFTYNVNPTHPICTPASSNIAIIIEPVLDINGSTITILPSPICFDDLSTTTLTATITQGANPIPDGTYNITYNLTGANTGTETINVTFSSGSGNFVINSTFVNTVGTTTLNINSITNTSSVTNCTRPITNLNTTFDIFENPDISNTNLTVEDFCLGQTGQAIINNINNSNILLSDDRYIITYTITDPNGITTTETISLIITNGNGIFSILDTLTSIIGNYTITITNIEDEDSGCSTIANLTDTFEVLPLPNGANMVVTIDDVCFGSDVIVSITGANSLVDGLYNLTYTISGAINAPNQVENNVNFTGGNATFTLPSGILVPGTSSLIITILTNSISECSSNNTLNIGDVFEINPLPDTTGAIISADDICISDAEVITIQNATSLQNGNYTIIYDLSGANSSTANTEVVTFTSGNGSFTIPSTLLINGGTTTIIIQNIINNTTLCGNNNLSANPISFNITDPGTPVLSPNGNIFCIQDIENPTIASLTANITSSGTITWYDAPTGGNAYNSTDPITNGTTYYTSLTSSSGCEGINRLEVTADLTNCPNLFIPDGFSPNDDGLNDTFYIKNIDVLFPNFSLEIYNRYGNVVYTGNINTPNFNGKSNKSTMIGNEILPTGVYFYILHYNDSQGKKPTQGRLYLSR